MINEILSDAKSRMSKSLDSLKGELAKLRTGRAHPSLLDQVMVPYYGSDTQLSQVANINIADARTLVVVPWEKPLLSAVEKAIRDGDLGLNPMTVGDGVRVPLPPLTEERRKSLVKVVKSEAENARVAVRNIRREINGQFKDMVKDKDISEDEGRKAEDSAQKLTDQWISEIDKLSTEKETDLMEV